MSALQKLFFGSGQNTGIACMGWLLLMVMLLLLLASAARAQVYTSSDFATTEIEQRYWSLAAQLRCLVCQNQTLADSNAELAGDLRRLLFEQLQTGKSDAQIRQFLVERYGNFVLYNPPFRLSTLVLWGGPVLLLALGLLLIGMRLRRAGNQTKTGRQ